MASQDLAVIKQYETPASLGNIQTYIRGLKENRGILIEYEEVK